MFLILRATLRNLSLTHFIDEDTETQKAHVKVPKVTLLEGVNANQFWIQIL